MLIKSILISIIQVVRNDLFNADPVLAIDQIILAVSFSVHVMSPYIAPNFSVLISNFQSIALGIFLILQVNGIISKAITISSSSDSKLLIA